MLFILITTTGFLQIRIVQKNIEELLKNEADILFRHIQREINLNLEYLTLLEQSPSIITPNFLNIMVYDEAIVDHLYTLLAGAAGKNVEAIPVANIIILDKDRRVVARKGSPKISPAYINAFFADKRDSFLRMPVSREGHLVLGVRTAGQVVFLSLSETELDMMRRRFIIKEILEGEEKRFNIAGIKILDSKGQVFAVMDNRAAADETFVVEKPLTSKYLPGYTMEIAVSGKIVHDMLRRTILNLVSILIILVLTGGAGTYTIFILHRKYEAKMQDMERELELKERLVSLGKLASGMAHEIKNPLNAIGMSVQRLKREFTPEKAKEEEYTQFIDIIRGELLRVDRIVGEFLLSTKAYAPFLQEELHALVEEIIIILAEKAKAGGIELKNSVREGTFLDCQKERIKQVFYNIILNAIEAMEKGGTIEISARQEHDTIQVSVRDSGPGIKKEDLHTIFDYYFTTKDKGMGLGLPVSYMIVKDHGGDLKAASDAGRGAIFLITLPVRHGEEEKKKKKTGSEVDKT